MALPIADDDLTSRSRILRAALELVAAHGADATSVRAIAAAAGVSPPLVVHHFGSKAALLAEVDAAVVADFRRTLAELRDEHPGDHRSASLGTAMAQRFGREPVLRAYLRRSLADGEDGAAAILDELLVLIDEELDGMRGAGLLRPDLDEVWTRYQILFLMVGPQLLEPVLSKHVPDAFESAVVDRRSASGHDFAANGLLGGKARG